MAKKKSAAFGYDELRAQLEAGELGRLYIFHGEERFLLERSVEALREKLLPDGMSGFNYRRYDGASLPLGELREATETLPVFAERTLVEVWDFDIFKRDEDSLAALMDTLADLPEHVCLVFIYDAVAFKPDGRTKAAAALKKLATAVEFDQPEQRRLVAWVSKHFRDGGKLCGGGTAEYLLHVTGGYMEPTLREIEKLTAFVPGDEVTRADIDALVEPTPDAQAYNMTDALAGRDFDGAAARLADLLAMREAPQKLMFHLTLKMRQLLAARLCLDSGRGRAALMEMCGIRLDFQAENLLRAARRVSVAYCRAAVLLCGETAARLNSGGGEGDLVLLLARLAALGAAA
jgi:DNA polymerase-3 subunit delta